MPIGAVRRVREKVFNNREVVTLWRLEGDFPATLGRGYESPIVTSGYEFVIVPTAALTDPRWPDLPGVLRSEEEVCARARASRPPDLRPTSKKILSRHFVVYSRPENSLVSLRAILPPSGPADWPGGEMARFVTGARVTLEFLPVRLRA